MEMRGMAVILAGSVLALGGCGSEPSTQESPAHAVGQSTLKTYADLKEMGFELWSSKTCVELMEVSEAHDWDGDARLRLHLMAANCALPTDDVTEADARAALGDDNLAIIGEGDVVTVFQRTIEGEAFFCCSLQGLDKRAVIGETVWVARQRLRGMDEATLHLSATMKNVDPDGYDIQPSGLEGEAEWRGPNALTGVEPVAYEDLEGSHSEHEVFSPQLNETRRISVFAPAGLRPDSPVIIAADGSTLEGIVERLIKDGEIRPVLMIGVHSGQDGIVEDRSEIGDTHALRAYDYFPPEVWEDDDGSKAGTRFDDHLSFVTDTLLKWASETYGMEIARERTVVMGWSNGGSFALNAGLLKNTVFGHAWPMSVGRGRLESDQTPVQAGPRARFRLSAGHYEPGFMYGTRISADVLSELGYDIDTRWYAEGHGINQWEARFVDNLKAVFPAHSE